MPTPLNRVALVTGSGKKRIGWHIADALARRGYHIAVHYHTSANEAMETAEYLSGQGIKAAPFQADLSDAASVGRLFAEVAGRFHRLDVLVNCAAIYGPKRLEDITANDLCQNLGANLVSTFLCCQRAGLVMAKQAEGGCIVNLGDWAIARPYLNHAAYFASKGAVPTLTRCFAVELGTRNPHVRVNCIEPGPVLFPPDMPEAERNEAIQSTLVKHAGHPDRVAAAVLFFVDNPFVTGVCLPVDGGRCVYAAGH